MSEGGCGEGNEGGKRSGRGYSGTSDKGHSE